MDKTTAAERTVARLLVYRLLGQVFSFPDAPVLDSLSGDRVWAQLLVAGEVLGLQSSATLGALQECLTKSEEDREQLMLDLQVEHTYLFITARPHVPASPYESAYTGQGTLMGESMLQVLEAYREAGLAMHLDYDALPDHVVAELEFVSYLVQREADARNAGDEAALGKWLNHQQRFLDEHLLRWAPKFLAKTLASARKPFYRLAAELAEVFLSAEAQGVTMTRPSKVGIEEDNNG